MSDTTLSAQSAAAVCAAALPPLSSPERFCIPRDDIEGRFVLEDAAIERLFPAQLPRVIVTHTRPEPMTGILRRIDGGPDCTSVLGYRNRGGTLDVAGMVLANDCTWAHILHAAAKLLATAPNTLLESEELAAIEGHGDPRLAMNAPRHERARTES